MEALTQAERAHFDENGYVRLAGFADAATCDAMLADVVAVTRAQADGRPEPHALVLPEANLVGRDGAPEELASKVFKLHRRGVFEAFSRRDDVLDRLTDLIGPELDCFLSQFIFKNPGAWGQPWHQDSWYFPFDPARPITGVWLAVTQATLENGCLHVLPGSHREPVHDHVPDRRPDANYGYVEIVDHDMAACRPRPHGPRRPAAVRQPPHAPLDGQRERRCPSGDGVPLLRHRDGRAHEGPGERLRDRAVLGRPTTASAASALSATRSGGRRPSTGVPLARPGRPRPGWSPRGS